MQNSKLLFIENEDYISFGPQNSTSSHKRQKPLDPENSQIQKPPKKKRRKLPDKELEKIDSTKKIKKTKKKRKFYSDHDDHHQLHKNQKMRKQKPRKFDKNSVCLHRFRNKNEQFFRNP